MSGIRDITVKKNQLNNKSYTVVKDLVKKYFESLAYFYSHLKYRVFVVLALSILIGVLDGFGLTMFLPLLQMVSESTSESSENMGKLNFLIEFFESLNIELTLLSILIIMAAFFYAKGIIQYITGVYKVNVQQWFIKKLRIQNIQGLNSLAYKFFVTSDVGRIQNTMTGEVERVAKSYLSYFRAFQYGILVTVYMAFAFTIDAQFAILVSIGGVLTNFLYKKLYKNTKGFSRTLTGETNIFQSLVIQNVANYKYLKATGSLGKYGEKLEGSATKIEGNNKKIGKLDALLTAGREPILVSVVVIVIYIQTTLLGSELAPILISLLFFYRALNYLMQMQVDWNKFLSVSGSLENMTLFQKELKNNKVRKGEKQFSGDINDIKLEDIHFYYDEAHILKDVSLEIKKNESIAFVGESGSGKTTLVNIIAGLLPVQKGKILVDDIPLAHYKLESFQQKIGYITQDPVIFNDTLFNNVTFWDEKTEENLSRFWNVLKQAAILDYVKMELPEKEETVLGSNGINLSGGQRQRISIARELYKDVEMLILDEATSALDSETEQAIQQNIDSLKGSYTILSVAHRISTIKNADRIVVMKNGRITDVGSFVELTNSSEYFKRLVEFQELKIS